jgi:CelD/BcsL family acetyltransferase involved in cellulose biosynthesis
MMQRAQSVAYRSRELRQEWQSLLAASDNVYVQYQAPEWYDHLCCTDSEGLLPPITIRDTGGRLVGIAPLRCTNRRLRFELKSRTLCSFRVRAVSILGGQPLLVPDTELHNQLFAAVIAAAPQSDAIYLHSVPTDSFCWSYLANSPWIEEHFFTYLPAGIRSFHVLDVPASFEAYLSKFKAKVRYNLKRQVRLLAEHGRGQLECMRIETAQQVPAFIRAAHAVARRSWQDERVIPDIYRQLSKPGSLKDLAHRGLLRSYVLLCADRPCALVLGYQYRDLYHYAEIAYDQSFRRFSPGTVLLYLLIEDLIRHRRPRCLNFGIGDAPYKHEFGNQQFEDASILLLRRTPANVLRVRSHAAFRACVNATKARLQHWRKQGAATP